MNMLAYIMFCYELESIAIWERFHIDWILYKESHLKKLTPLYVHLLIDEENYIEVLMKVINDFRNIYDIFRKSLTFPSDHYPILTVFKLS
jgi:hypothetical protein